MLGIRPEHLSLSPIQGQAENVIKAKVELVEPLGAIKYIYFTSTDGNKLVVDASPHLDVHSGDIARVHLDVEQLHFFGSDEMGKSIGDTQ